MKKRILPVLLILTLTITLLAAGCSDKNDVSSNDTSKETSGAAKDSASEDDSVSANDSTSEEDSASEGEKKYDGGVIGYICKDLSQQWFINVTNVLVERAKELGAEDVILMDSAMNPEKYLTALDNMIAKNVDCLIVCPPDQQLSQITVDRCKEAGIKVFADADPLIDADGKLLAPALQLDAYRVGYDQGTWLGNYVLENDLMKNIDTMAYLALTMETVSSTRPRAEGAIDAFKATVPDFPEDKIIKADYDGTPDMAFDVATAILTANPKIKTWIVTAPNEEGALGATRAIEQAGLDKDATVAGLGAYFAKDEFKKDYSCFKASGYFSAKEDGTVIAEAAMKWIHEDIVPFSEYIKEGEEFGVYPLGAIMVDASNYEEIMGEDAK